MNFKRQKLLLFLAGSAGAIALSVISICGVCALGIAIATSALMFKSLVSLVSREKFSMPFITAAVKTHSLLKQLSLQPVRRAVPPEISSVTQLQQIKQYHSCEVEADLVLPQRFNYNILDTRSDKVGNSHFGYKNDYLAYMKISESQL
jgi:secreted PhoX family phosphatase